MDNPSIIPYFYTGRTISEIIRNYSYDLALSDKAADRLKANKLLEYDSMISDSAFLNLITNWFNEIYEILDRRFPELLFLFEGRRKSLLSTVNKIELIQSEAADSSSPNTLNRLRDLMAFRIILLDQKPEELIKMLYQIADTIIDFFRIKGFEPVRHSSIKGADSFKKEENPQVFVPVRSYASDTNRHFIKDYVLCPKNNGYQSLHIVIYDPQTRRYFEIQLRTFSMHLYAETGEAEHEGYKTQRYIQKSNSLEDIDFSRINLRGFAKTSNGFVDSIGLIQSLNILKRHKTIARIQKSPLVITI